MIAAALVAALAGFAALGLAMHKHHRAVFGEPASRRLMIALRSTGWVLLALSFAASVAGSGWAVGPVLWLGLLTLAALAVALLLTFGARKARGAPQ